MSPNKSRIRARHPAVAGLFYPDDPYELRVVVQGYLDAAPASGARPKAIIVPHAGYAYSAAVAASAYSRLVGASPPFRRVILAGPSHRIPVSGIAAPDLRAFDSPLGRVPLDHDAITRLAELPQVQLSNLPHRMEHSLEVQLPFLQVTLGEFSLVPLAVGDATPDAVAAALEACWGGPETLIVASTDLSHYHPYEEAQRLDTATARRIAGLADDLQDEEACGCRLLNGLLRLARRRGLRIEPLALRNSGDTSGDRSRVVGYAAFALYGD